MRDIQCLILKFIPIILTVAFKKQIQYTSLHLYISTIHLLWSAVQYSQRVEERYCTCRKLQEAIDSSFLREIQYLYPHDTAVVAHHTLFVRSSQKTSGASTKKTLFKFPPITIIVHAGIATYDFSILLCTVVSTRGGGGKKSIKRGYDCSRTVYLIIPTVLYSS